MSALARATLDGSDLPPVTGGGFQHELVVADFHQLLNTDGRYRRLTHEFVLNIRWRLRSLRSASGWFCRLSITCFADFASRFASVFGRLARHSGRFDRASSS